jgi:flagellar M-ring protein FliF
VVDRSVAAFRSISRAARILLVSTVLAAVALASYFGYQQTHEPYAVLFSQLEQDDAASIVAKLKELNAPYRLGVGGASIEVPESRVGDLRLELAGAGLPRGGGVGFESFDKMRLGATEFEQRVLYRRALEGEIARTIGTLATVQSARIHLVLPEKSVFVARTEPASASIVLRLRPGRSLGPSEVAGIVHLTATAVPGLAADRVALVTTEGEMLHKPRAAGDGTQAGADDDDPGSRQRVIEAQLEDRARAMLEKVVGPGHVDVRVTAELDSARVEHSEDHYDPGKTTLRSEESSLERSTPGLDDSVAGVPGAESNLPTGAAPAASAALAAAAKGDAGAAKPALLAAKTVGTDLPYHESHTRNYEVDHVSEKRLLQPGALKRIAVAVVLDGVLQHTPDGQQTLVPRDRAELQKMEALVRSAVGASDARGDLVTVDSMLFDVEKAPEPTPSGPIPALVKGWRAYLPAMIGAAALLVILAVAVVLGRRRRAPETVAQLLPAAVVMPEISPSSPAAEMRAAVIERAAADPATAALVLRAWLATSAGVGSRSATGD